MREILRELKKMGKTILISSHILPELAEMCDEIGVIDNGKLVAHGSVADIQQQLEAEKIIEVKVRGMLESAASFFEDDPNLSSLEMNEELKTIKFLYKGSEVQQAELLRLAILNGIAVVSFKETETDLEDVFMEITKGVKPS